MSAGPNSEFAQALQGSATLTLLRRLLDTSALAGPAVARRAGLSHSEMTALELLMSRSVGPADLARELGVTSAASSGIVDRLEARGHVRRIPHATDGRRTQVELTESGREEVIGHLMPMFLALRDLDQSLDSAEREAVERFLSQAIDAVRRVL